MKRLSYIISLCRLRSEQNIISDQCPVTPLASTPAGYSRDMAIRQCHLNSVINEKDYINISITKGCISSDTDDKGVSQAAISGTADVKGRIT